MAMEFKAASEDIARICHPHPSMSEVMREPKTINELSKSLHRNRSSITKDVGVLERAGLVRSSKQPNPGHGVQKLVCALAAKIEVSATLEAA